MRVDLSIGYAMVPPRCDTCVYAHFGLMACEVTRLRSWHSRHTAHPPAQPLHGRRDAMHKLRVGGQFQRGPSAVTDIVCTPLRNGVVVPLIWIDPPVEVMPFWNVITVEPSVTA